MTVCGLWMGGVTSHDGVGSKKISLWGVVDHGGSLAIIKSNGIMNVISYRTITFVASLMADLPLRR